MKIIHLASFLVYEDGRIEVIDIGEEEALYSEATKDEPPLDLVRIIEELLAEGRNQNGNR